MARLRSPSPYFRRLLAIWSVKRNNERMLSWALKKILGTSHEREVKKLRPHVEQINALEPKISKLSDQKLKAKTAEFKEKLENGASLDELLHESFAVARREIVGPRSRHPQRVHRLRLVNPSPRFPSGRLAGTRKPKRSGASGCSSRHQLALHPGCESHLRPSQRHCEERSDEAIHATHEET